MQACCLSIRMNVSVKQGQLQVLGDFTESSAGIATTHGWRNRYRSICQSMRTGR